MKDTLRLSYSKTETFLGCRKRYWWIYHEDLTPTGKGKPLQVGDIVHRLRDVFYQGKLTKEHILNLKQTVKDLFPENSEAQSDEVAFEGGILFKGYLDKLYEQDIKVMHPELVLETKMVEPVTKTPFILYSRLDGVCQTPDGRVWRDELKTTGKIDYLYLKGLREGLQTGIALWLADELMDEKLAGTMFNLVIKTKVPDAKRMPAPRQEWVVENAKKTVYGVVRSINRGDFYPTQSECIGWNRECDYLKLCSNDTPATREAHYQSRTEEFKRSKSIQLKGGEEKNAAD